MNKYSNLSLGVSNSIIAGLYRGSLYKFINILAADFSEESYTNIGAFTTEHLS